MEKDAENLTTVPGASSATPAVAATDGTAATAAVAAVHAPARLPVPPWALAITAMLSVQLGSALSVNLIAAVGPAGTAWLRLTAGALIFLALVRPPLREIRRADVPVLLALGVATGLMSTLFLAAIERIPLGTAVAIEFLGPLTVAAVRSHSTRMLTPGPRWRCSVVLLTDLAGEINWRASGFAALGAAAGAFRTHQRIGDRFRRHPGLSSIPIAAAAASHGATRRRRAATGILAAALGLSSCYPCSGALEMLALRMTHTAFGT